MFSSIAVLDYDMLLPTLQWTL